ncbi:MAG: phosphatidylinositol kinase [Actinobacteria bacterium]|nr:phosphatidylinositol kinase [Actinomycetota bacterium]
MEVIGRLIDASNASLLCQYPDGKKIIYKPIAGERPLWDFPDGNLASREVVAYYISELGGFHLVPKTVLRDGPFGLGAVQEWIEVDEEVDVVNFVQSDGSILRNMALFDAIINNADRKFGHILVGPDGDVYGCDHGVSFHEEDKLRTVLWQFADLDLTEHEIEKIKRILGGLDESYLADLLTTDEIDALKSRAGKLLDLKKFPMPNPNWPAIPWPPY